MKKGEKRKANSRKTASPVRKKTKKAGAAPHLKVPGATRPVPPEPAMTTAGGSQARDEMKAESASPSTEIDPASKASEKGGLHPALPVGGATQAPPNGAAENPANPPNPSVENIGPASPAGERGGSRLAPPAGIETQAPLMEEAIEFLGLSLNREEYAIPVSQIKEIIRPIGMTAIPRSTPGLMGIISLRGVIIPVFNLKNKLTPIQSENREMREETDEALKRIIIIQIDEGILGLFVDEVTEVIKIKESDIQPSPPLFSQNGQELIRGITRFRERLVILLFIPRVIGVIKEEVEQIARV
jgi:purine-binding chemotaxis protein CheW